MNRSRKTVKRNAKYKRYKRLGGTLIFHNKTENEKKIKLEPDDYSICCYLNPATPLIYRNIWLESQKRLVLKHFKFNNLNAKNFAKLNNKLLEYINEQHNKFCEFSNISKGFVDNTLEDNDMTLLVYHNNHIIGLAVISIYPLIKSISRIDDVIDITKRFNIDIEIICASLHFALIGQSLMEQIYLLADHFQSNEIRLKSTRNFSTLNFYFKNGFQLVVVDEIVKLLEEAEEVQLNELSLIQKSNLYPLILKEENLILLVKKYPFTLSSGLDETITYAKYQGNIPGKRIVISPLEKEQLEYEREIMRIHEQTEQINLKSKIKDKLKRKRQT